MMMMMKFRQVVLHFMVAIPQINEQNLLFFKEFETNDNAITEGIINKNENGFVSILMDEEKESPVEITSGK